MAEPDPAPPRASFDHQPALDGLRGLALLAIVAFHAQVPGVGGAFLSVSTFFTLSGFLITTVALGAHRRHGHVDVRDFYRRRARRLLPASLVAIAAITVLTAVLGDTSQVARLRGDGLSALLYVENWHLIAAGDSYGAIFDSPSGFTHFWTLAIEEQFYLAFPLALAAVLAVGRGSRRVLAAVLGVAILGATAWTALLLERGASLDRLYFGTDTRIAEILVGCLAAVGWERLRARTSGRLAGGRHPALGWVGAVALVAMLWSWHAAARTTEAFYRGGLVVYAGLTVLVIVAAVQPGGPVRRVLGWRPLVLVGTVSYAAYLVHWPIFVALDQRSPLGPWARFAVGLALTLVLAAASLRWIERPVRSGRWPADRRLLPAGAAGMAVVAVVVVGLTASRTVVPATDYEEAAQALSTSGVGGAPPPEDDGELTAEEAAAREEWFALQERIAASTAPRVGFFGDSTATMTGFGVSDWATEHLDLLAPGTGQTDIGCGLVTEVARRVDGDVSPINDNCAGWLDRWRAAVESQDLQIAVVQLGPWDVHDTQLDPGGPFLVVGEDPEIDARYAEALDEAIGVLEAHVDTVVLLASPDVVFGRVDGRDPPRAREESDPARMAAFRALLTDAAARHERTEVLDLAGWVAARPDDGDLRPDGVHFTETTTRTVATWLAPALLAAHQGLAP